MCNATFLDLQQDDYLGIREAYCMAFPTPNMCSRRTELNTNWCSHSAGRLFLGDFNGDNRKDMLCHDVVTGFKWVDLATSTGLFGNSDTTSFVNFCGHPNGQLFVGDFNGDGRDDLLCHDRVNGGRWIDYAEAPAQFGAPDWADSANFCGHPDGRLHVGDFNGDGRDDLLCFEVVNGQRWIDYSDVAGALGGVDWYNGAEYCGNPNRQLHIGDFNADGRDDLMCHHLTAGQKWVDFADGAGQFNDNYDDYTSGLNWCAHPTGRLSVADFNSDGRADLVCHDTANGYKWLAYGHEEAQVPIFDQTSQAWSMSWCFAPTLQLLFGDVDGNGAADFLCHDPNTGYKWQAFQFP